MTVLGFGPANLGPCIPPLCVVSKRVRYGDHSPVQRIATAISIFAKAGAVTELAVLVITSVPVRKESLTKDFRDLRLAFAGLTLGRSLVVFLVTVEGGLKVGGFLSGLRAAREDVC